MRWGVDLGGTKIEGVVLDEDAHELTRLRIPTEAVQGYDHILGQIARLIELLAQRTGLPRPTKLGFGTPGSLHPTSGLLHNSNTQCLNGRPLQRDLEHLLDAKVCIANDANCFTLAEARMGAARSHRVVFGVILGTGVGGGLVIDGAVIPGRQGICGEWGHNVLDPLGRPCYCGKVGCVETVLSGPAVEHAHEVRTGHFLSLPQIATSPEEDCQETIRRLGMEFGRALAMVVNVIDPDVIVVGGGVGNIDAIYPLARESLQRWMFHPKGDTPIVRPQLGDSAGVFGAALLST